MHACLRTCLYCALATIASNIARADESLLNRGNDPFFQISQSIAQCPAPLGPLTTRKQWLDEAHYRIERGNSCWIEGRCRLSNAYLYDPEIAESLKRRLAGIAAITTWREKTSLWIMIQRRFIYVQGCVSPDFDAARFLDELAKTADVERIIDNTTTHPHSGSLPYETRSKSNPAPTR